MSNIIFNITKPWTRSTPQSDVSHCLKVYIINNNNGSHYFKVYKMIKDITLLYPYLNKILEEKKRSKTNIEWNHKTIKKKKSSYDKTSEEQNQG